jgi:hypothetical protein
MDEGAAMLELLGSISPEEESVGGNSRTTFSKRQKERARQEKQAEKAQRRAQRKIQQNQGETSEKPKDLVVTYDEEGQAQGFDFHDF